MIVSRFIYFSNACQLIITLIKLTFNGFILPFSASFVVDFGFVLFLFSPHIQ